MRLKSLLPGYFFRRPAAFVLVSSALCGAMAFGSEQPKASRPGGPSAAVAAAPEAPAAVTKTWRLRRADFQNTYKAVQADDPAALVRLNAVLAEFEAHPLARTPLENMDIIGSVYLPKYGIEQSLVLIVLNDVLGWYDALRFTTESGRAEILNNEGLFERALSVVGPARAGKAVQFLKDNPDRTSQLVQKGIELAKPFENSENYDRHWPDSYGLPRLACRPGGPCAPHPSLPMDQWDAAWDQAVHRVLTYYQVQRTEHLP